MTSQRDHALDGLRGIAAMAVVLSHIAAMVWVPFLDKTPVPSAWVYALWHLGAPAVDLFLVLSGYVVAKSLMRRRQEYVPYALSRYIRLAPIAWIGVLAGIALRNVDILPPPGTTIGLLALRQPIGMMDLMGFTTLVTPILNAQLVNVPLWTISIEMQAAFLMPPLAWAATRWPRAIVPVALAILIGTGLAINYDYPFIFAGFVYGAALAALERRIPKAPRPVALAVVGLAVLMSRHVLGTDDPFMRLVCAAGATLLILAVQQGAWKRFLRSRPAQWLGRLSYPLYAIHWPIMAAATMTLGWDIAPGLAAAASLPLILIAAAFLRRHVDQPSVTLSHMVKSVAPR